LLASKGEFSEIFVGKKAEVNKGLLKLKYPMEHGIIKDWQDMQAIWNYAFSELKISPQDQPVLLTESILNPSSNREKMGEIFFESYNVPACYICSQALLSAYSMGKLKGVVLDCGDGVCQCAPVYEGYILNNAANRIDIGGRYLNLYFMYRDVTNYLNLLLRKAGNIFQTSVFY
jgi:centractin